MTATDVTEALASVKRQSILISQYLTDNEILLFLPDYIVTVDEVDLYDVTAAAVACLRYVRGIVPTMKKIGDITLMLETIENTIAALNPGGIINATRPVYELGEFDDITS
jgi:hypothetical protein